ncbi:junctional adhesion molecule B-like [Alosa pseudoharengus]|uniref:junctional adhesion molecule B-like n=1 Tax=Alosa pseudoharengus TaxID=34774 RepID=UPI003F8CCF67
MTMSSVASVCVMALLTFQGVYADEWNVTYPSESICVVVGDSVDMSCSYTYPPEVTIKQAYWTKLDSGDHPDLRGDPQYRDRIVITQYATKQCDLRIRSVTLLDAGKYYCSFTTHTEGQQWIGKPGVDLHVRDAPHIPSVSISPSGDIVEGTDVTLTCKNRSDLPVQSYNWYKRVNTTHLHLGTGNPYTIKDIAPEDNGEYFCRSGYEFGNKYSCTVRLQVFSEEKSSIMAAVIPVFVCGPLALLTVVFLLRRKCLKGVLAKRDEQDASGNIRGNPDTILMIPVHPSQNPNTSQPDAVYQSLNPNTTQPDAVYQSLNPNTTQPDAVYQSLNPNTTQPDASAHE